MILFINACVRKNSRTKILADHLLKKLYYVMTAGGVFVPEEFGFGYVKAMSESFYGIKEFEYIQALGLDVDGADEKKIIGDAIKEIDKLF